MQVIKKYAKEWGQGKRKGRGRGKTERYWANPEGTGCLTGDLGHVHGNNSTICFTQQSRMVKN